jgi:hypothetical protein
MTHSHSELPRNHVGNLNSHHFTGIFPERKNRHQQASLALP